MSRLVSALVLFAALLPSAALAQARPPEGAWLRYRFEQRLEDGRGAYDGYHEWTRAHARYELEDVSDAGFTAHARYAWGYQSPETARTGVEDRRARIRLPDRRYTSERTDSSDYDSSSASELAAWMWIPPDIRVGESVPIFDRRFEIEQRDVPVLVAGEMRSAIRATSAFQSTRDDEYGSFRTSIEDQYWFDAATGMFLREEHVERARGNFDGRSASFTLRTEIEVVDASYAPNPSPPPEPDYSVAPAVERPSSGASDDGSAMFVMVVLGLTLVAGLWWLVRRARRPRSMPSRMADGTAFRIETCARVPELPSGLSEHLDPFVAHMAGVASASGNRVCIATTSAGTVGLAIEDRAGRVATIFARDSDVCEALRRTLGTTELFSERRHPTLASVVRVDASAPAHAYNVYETFDVLRLTERPADLGYDAELVDPMTDGDRDAVLALLTEVYGMPCGPWLDAARAAGDLAWVARQGGAIVGFAMATLVGAHARLHTLTVRETLRGKGIGTALYRARLRALFDMGATEVVTECATWNVAALELAHGHGFAKVGAMYVESAQSTRVERRFVRR